MKGALSNREVLCGYNSWQIELSWFVLFFFFSFTHKKFSPSVLQDGMLKHKGTYEIISPEDIGLSRSNESGIVLGKLRYGL